MAETRARVITGQARVVLERIAVLVCPPELADLGLGTVVLRDVDLHLGCLSPMARRVAGPALRLFDQAARLHPASRGRRFVRLDDRQADAYLRHVLYRRNGPVAAAVRLLKGLAVVCCYELPQVKAALGYDPDSYVAEVTARRLARHGSAINAAEQAERAERGEHGGHGEHGGRARPAEPAGIITRDVVDGDVRVSCDVVVVGSGAGGATVAAALAEAGVDVVIVEEGGYHPTRSYGTSVGRALRTLYRDGGVQAAIGRPPVLFAEGRCVGGSTVINGGMSFRTPEPVLDRWARDPSLAVISAEAMRPYFETVERRLHVSGQDPETIGRDSELLKAGADAKGWQVIPNLRNQLHCAGSNNCALGCPTGAKRSMLLTHLPRALAHGARLYAECRVDRVTRRGRTASGVEGSFLDADRRPGPRLTVTAPLVVVAGGAVQTPALLMRSGFRSPSGQLGRNLALHPNARLVALFDSDVRGWQGVHQAYQVREFAGEGILIAAVNIPPSLVAMGMADHGPAVRTLMDDYDRMVVAGCLIEDSSTGSVRTVPGLGTQVFYQISDRDAEKVVRGIALTAELMFAAGARRVLAPFAGAPDLRDPDDIADLVSRPVPRRSMELFTVHLMGTARMSDDPTRGVVSSFGELHGARGLFVADASLFPGPVGVNPMETIVALALRNADWLIENRSRYGI